MTLVEYNCTGLDGTPDLVTGILRRPTGLGKRKAIIIVHTGNGWGKGASSQSAENVTIQYAKFLCENGFVTFEPRFFLDRENKNEYRDLPRCFNALKFLSTLDYVDANSISITGYSYGGFLSFAAATEWAHRRYCYPGTSFCSYLPFYPICWILTDHINRLPGYPAFPPDIFDRWVRRPMAIFQGGKDDYEDQDPLVLDKLISAIPDNIQRKMTTGFLYPNTSHGWDRGYDYTFEDPHSRKGSGGTNTNVFNPYVTIQAKQDLLNFLNS